MTLLEILLVLALIVMIGALATPRLAKTFARQRVQNSGEILRATFNRARVDAMRSGKIQVFRCELDTAKSTVTEFEPDDDGSRRAAVVADDPTTSAAALAPIKYDDEIKENAKKLPDDMRFILCESLGSRRNLAAQEAVFGSGALVDDLSQSVPIFFYPDGSSSHSRVIVSDGKGNAIAVTVRGITGVPSVGAVTPLEELLNK